MAPRDLQFTEVPIKDLPLYNYDFDMKAYRDFIERVTMVLPPHS